MPWSTPAVRVRAIPQEIPASPPPLPTHPPFFPRPDNICHERRWTFREDDESSRRLGDRHGWHRGHAAQLPGAMRSFGVGPVGSPERIPDGERIRWGAGERQQ